MQSMTGYAALSGETDGWSWVWDLRSVNGRGLDIRLRVPDWIEGLEPLGREQVRKSMARGSVTLSLRLNRVESAGGLGIDGAARTALLEEIAKTELEAREQHGLTLAPSRATDVLSLCRQAPQGARNDGPALLALFKKDLPTLIESFLAARASEGEKLHQILSGQLDEVEGLVADAAREAKDRQADQAATLKANLARVLDNSDGADADRVAQELALIVVKTDVTEEIDRLGAHITAARELLDTAEPVGRKLDFLIQEFNREANTLCSKAQSQTLTRVGLDLKARIDQMREQVQNVE